MKREIPENLQQVERKLLAAFERHGNDGRAMTIESLVASSGARSNAKELALALKNLVDRGLVRRAGEDPIPGSAIAFRLVTAASRERGDKAGDQPALSGSPATPAEQVARHAPVKSAPRRQASVVAE